MRSPPSSWCTASRTGRAAGRSTPPSTSCRRGPTSSPWTSGGTGARPGRSTFGVAEPADVGAAGRRPGARSHPGCPVVALGISLGGASALFAAGGGTPLAGVVAVSAPAWRDLTSPAGVRLARWTRTRRGRALILALSGTRVDPAAGEPGDLRARSRPSRRVSSSSRHDPQERCSVPSTPRRCSPGRASRRPLWWCPAAARPLDADARAARAGAGRGQRAAGTAPTPGR